MLLFQQECVVYILYFANIKPLHIDKWQDQFKKGLRIPNLRFYIDFLIDTLSYCFCPLFVGG